MDRLLHEVIVECEGYDDAQLLAVPHDTTVGAVLATVMQPHIRALLQQYEAPWEAYWVNGAVCDAEETTQPGMRLYLEVAPAFVCRIKVRMYLSRQIHVAGRDQWPPHESVLTNVLHAVMDSPTPDDVTLLRMLLVARVYRGDVLLRALWLLLLTLQQLPLSHAAAPRIASIAELVLESGDVDINSPCPFDATGELLSGAAPLHIAAEIGCIALADLLIRRHASVNVRDIDAWTPLHTAAAHGQKRMVWYFMQHRRGRPGVGADVTAQTAQGLCPLHLAAAAGDRDVASMLVGDDCRDTLLTLDNRGRTPVAYAMRCGHQELLPLLTPPATVMRMAGVKRSADGTPVALPPPPAQKRAFDGDDEITRRLDGAVKKMRRTKCNELLGAVRTGRKRVREDGAASSDLSLTSTAAKRLCTAARVSHLHALSPA